MLCVAVVWAPFFGGSRRAPYKGTSMSGRKKSACLGVICPYSIYKNHLCIFHEVALGGTPNGKDSGSKLIIMALLTLTKSAGKFPVAAQAVPKPKRLQVVILKSRAKIFGLFMTKPL